MPIITKKPGSDENRLEFTLSGVDVAYANGIRRTILADIPILVFNTSLKERKEDEEIKCDCEIKYNTTRLNNEIIKQRLSCIPICVSDIRKFDSYVKEHILEVIVENTTEDVLIVTTKDFKIKNISTGEYLSKNAHNEIFPPYLSTNGQEYHIQFVRLRPLISNEIPGEKISLTCKFSVGTAKDDSSFNVAGTCTYRRTPDISAISENLSIKENEFKSKGLNEQEIELEKKNWQLLDGMRIVVPDSFDFIIETVGIYSNERLLNLACKTMITKLEDLQEMMQKEEFEIQQSNNTKPNCYEIHFSDYDYTIGNILNYEMYNIFFIKKNYIHSVSTKKMHPHDKYITMEVSIVRDDNPKENLITMITESCQNGIKTIKNIIRQNRKLSSEITNELSERSEELSERSEELSERTEE